MHIKKMCFSAGKKLFTRPRLLRHTGPCLCRPPHSVAERTTRREAGRTEGVQPAWAVGGCLGEGGGADLATIWSARSPQDAPSIPRCVSGASVSAQDTGCRLHDTGARSPVCVAVFSQPRRSCRLVRLGCWYIQASSPSLYGRLTADSNTQKERALGSVVNVPIHLPS